MTFNFSKMYLFKVTFSFAFARGFLDTKGKKGYYSLERGREVDFDPDSDGRRSSTETPPLTRDESTLVTPLRWGWYSRGAPDPPPAGGIRAAAGASFHRENKTQK